MKKLLEIKNLRVSFFNKKKQTEVLKGIEFELFEYEIVSLVGESGSGKSILALSILNLLEKNCKITDGEICLYEQDLVKLKEKYFRKIRGSVISIIFQDPFSSLNPTMKIGKQLLEAFKEKKNRLKAISILKDVGITDAEMRFDQYPHELSGGMRQRVMIAIAIASNPKIIIADEPTTSLDPTIQNQILDLLLKIQKNYKTSIIFISHDISLVANFANKIFVMKDGKIIEKGKTNKLLFSAINPYTKLLINSTLDFEKIKKEIKILEPILKK